MTIAQQIVLHSSNKSDIIFKAGILSTKVGGDYYKEWYYFEDESFIEVCDSTDQIFIGDSE